MDGPPQQEEDFSQIPVSDRLAHKNWKARVSAYESLIKTFQTTASDNDPAFKPYIHDSELLKKIATDSNAVAQEKGVECLVNLVKFAGETVSRTRETVVPALVDKCFGSTRTGTKNHAVELTLQYVEVENAAVGVVGDIIPGLSAKQPKVVACCVLALKEIVRCFGTTVVPPPVILKALPKIFAHSDKTVRAEGTQLTNSLYQCLGLSIEPFLADLKPVQVKELKEGWESMEKDGKGKGSLKPERLTRAHAREAEQRELAGAGGGGDAADELQEPEQIDPRSLAEESNIVPKLQPGLQANLTSSKWKERKEALDDLLLILKASLRIKDAPELGELARSLTARIQGDANVNCVILAANCLEALASGLSSSFARHREAVIPPILERLKERKATVTDAIGAALDAVFRTTTLVDIVGDITTALSSKNPQVKEGSLKFLSRCISTSTTPVQPAQIKPLSEALASLLEDSFEGARNEAATALGTLMKMVGERPLNAIMGGLADVRRVKVQEAYEKATVKSKIGAGGPPKPVAAQPQEPKKKAAVKKAPAPSGSIPSSMDDEISAELEGKKPTKKPPARLAQKKTPGATPAAPVVKKPPLTAPAGSKPPKGGASAPGSLDLVKFKHPPEDAELLAVDLIPTNISLDLVNSNWKTRLAALEEMTTWLEGVVREVDSEVVVRFLGKKGWNEKNFQVSAKLYGLLVVLAEGCPSFGRASVALAVPHLSEKLGDIKLKKPAGDTLMTFAEKTSLQFVLNQAYDPLSKQKAPKVLADALMWVDQALFEFGIAGVSLRPLIEFLKAALKNSNAAVRTSATKTLVTVKLFAGSSIKDLLEDLNPQLLNTILAEFDKVEGNSAPEPTRQCLDVVNSSSQLAAGPGKSAPVGSDPLDDLFPRVELDGLLKGTTILADGKSDAWKTKKEALETLQAILDQGSNKRLKQNMGEIGQVLKARVADSNIAVKLLALDIVSRIATGMGRLFEKHNRLFVVPVAAALSDQKANIRTTALQTLTAIAAACEGIESMVHGLGTALESPNPVQKASLLNWLVEWFNSRESSPHLDIVGWTGSIISSLDDRNGDVRKGAQAMLPILIASAGFDYVMSQTSSLKPASRATAVPLIQAARPSAPVASPSSKSVLAPIKPSVLAPIVTSGTASPSPESPMSLAPAHSAPSTSVTGVRKQLPQASITRPLSRAETPTETGSIRITSKIGGLRRPGAAAAVASKSTPPLNPASYAHMPFTTVNLDAKKARLARDASKWINEGGTTRKDLAELLQHQMEPHSSKELVALLFSHDHNAVNDHVAGLTMMADFYASVQAEDAKFGLPLADTRNVCIANADLALKYWSIKAHEPQSNLIAKNMDLVENVLSFLQSVNYQFTDAEALCFIPTMVYKLGDAREPVRTRVQGIIQSITKVYAYSRLFQLLLDHGFQSKVAKTRQGTLDELANLLRKFGMAACEPNKALPKIAGMIADKDAQVRKSALSAIGETYVLVGEKVWSLVGSLPPKDKTQLEERLRRVAGPSSSDRDPMSAARAAASITPQPSSPISTTRTVGLPQTTSSPTAAPRLVRPASPSRPVRPVPPSNIGRSSSPLPNTRLPGPLHLTGPSYLPGSSNIPGNSSPSAIGRPKQLLPSRLGPPRSRIVLPSTSPAHEEIQPTSPHSNGHNIPSQVLSEHTDFDPIPQSEDTHDDITITISSILSNDPSRSVDALKKIQKVLDVGPDAGPSSAAYREMAEHTEGLIETIILQMAHVFERPEKVGQKENFRLAKHLIQTLNAFCDHNFLAESLTVDILTSLLEELTLRLLQTDNSEDSQLKDLSRFINMIILRLFATARRMSVFRALFKLLLQIVKPFPANGTSSESREFKVAELVLKCIWKLARNIPQDLEKQALDPVELFPAMEQFLQSVPPNEWRARATNKVPCGDMPLRTMKVIIQHVVAFYSDEVYDLLSAAFDDPSATIVYPYVYRILNSTSRAAEDALLDAKTAHPRRTDSTRLSSSAVSRPLSPQETASSTASGDRRHSSPTRARSASSISANGEGFAPTSEEPDPDAQLLTIIGHISSETTGAMHKEGITELHHFIKAYPHKKPRVEKMLESTGPAFRKYITRALASRAAEDNDRDAAVAHTLSKLESNKRDSDSPVPSSPVRSETSPRSPRRGSTASSVADDKLSRLHDIFQYRTSNGSSYTRSATPSGLAPPG